MTDDELDRLILNSMPKVEPSPERLDRIMADVMMSLPSQKPPRWRLWLQDMWLLPNPAVAYGVPIVAALVLGVVAGGYLNPAQAQSDPLAALIQSSRTSTLLDL